MSEQRIRYVNQAKVTKGDKVERDWSDSCRGHDTLYAAIECRDGAEAMAKPDAKPTDLTDALIAASFAAMKDAGLVVHIAAS